MRTDGRNSPGATLEHKTLRYGCVGGKKGAKMATLAHREDLGAPRAERLGLRQDSGVEPPGGEVKEAPHMARTPPGSKRVFLSGEDGVGGKVSEDRTSDDNNSRWQHQLVALAANKQYRRRHHNRFQPTTNVFPLAPSEPKPLRSSPPRLERRQQQQQQEQ